MVPGVLSSLREGGAVTLRARLAKQERRFHAAYRRRREQIIARQRAMVEPSARELLVMIESGQAVVVECPDQDTLIARAIAEWDRAHPAAVPYARGYHRKRGGRW